MNFRRLQIFLACFVVLSAAAVAQLMVPRISMARTAESLDLEKSIPRQFGQWTAVPEVRIVEPPGSNTLSREVYSQEVARGYRDSDGHVVMLLVAYGTSQSDRLQLHLPEICYAAQGFRVSRPTETLLSLSPDMGPVRLRHLVAQREARLEPISYWMRIGNDIASSVLERQVLKIKYGIHGLIPDGALVRVSTTGIPEKEAFAIEDQFIREFLKFVDPAARTFLLGNPTQSLGSHLWTDLISGNHRGAIQHVSPS